MKNNYKDIQKYQIQVSGVNTEMETYTFSINYSLISSFFRSCERTLRLNPKNGDFWGLGSQVHWTCSQESTPAVTKWLKFPSRELNRQSSLSSLVLRDLKWQGRRPFLQGEEEGLRRRFLTLPQRKFLNAISSMPVQLRTSI